MIETEKKFESVAFSNDDTMILCAVREGEVSLYQSDSGSKLTVVDVGHEIESMSIVPGKIQRVHSLYCMYKTPIEKLNGFFFFNIKFSL